MDRRFKKSTRARGLWQLSPIRAIVLVCFAMTASGQPDRARERSAYPVSNTHIVYHDVRVDRDGAILPWYDEKPSIAYDHNLRLIWNFWHTMRTCGNHIPYYLQHQVWKEREDDSRGLGGDQINMALDSWNLLYLYLGDEALHEDMEMMANFWLDHGMSSPDLLYGNLPYPYNLDGCSGTLDGDMRAGKGYLQPDKAGSFGYQLVTLYKITGKKHYLNAAVKIANTLSATVKTGDAEHSPWGFRVDAATGKPAQGTKKGVLITSTYTTNWTPSLRLFQQLIALHAGRTETYRRSSSLVTEWLNKFAIPSNKWGPFFEDIPTEDYSDTEINADALAAYILDADEWGPGRLPVVRKILEWTEDRLGNHNFAALHVVPINEQTAYEVPGNSHTARHASVRLLYCEKSGDCADKQQQVLRLNWATYSVNGDGRNRYPNDDIWLTDGYGDYVRHYLRAMASMPELAPDDQNHLLRTSSAIQSIKYSRTSITYSKFDARSEERLKLGASAPLKVRGGTFIWNPESHILDVHALSRRVVIELKPLAR